MTEPIFSYEPRRFAGFDELAEIALDLRWSWDHSADDIWRSFDPELWDLTRNPWVMLETTSPEKIEHLSADPTFRSRVEGLAKRLRDYHTEESWFQRACADTPLRRIAYFSMEFMLGEALPIYSGGLGNVAGDQLKAASDLGVPIVGVGLLYQQGYFRQSLAADGSQAALYPYNDPGQLQVTPARDEDGEWMRLPVQLPHYKVWLRAWQAQVGRVKLYLLDTNDPANPPLARGVTSQLYGGGPTVRLAQEMVLGIGGWRLLRALKLEPDVCHLNEGHAAFAVLERAADCMATTGLSFDDALQVTRSGNLFTTHTPVAAGFDRFPPDLMQQFLGAYVRDRLRISFRDFLALARQDPDDETEPFNMAYLAIRGSGAVNGVSRLHDKVSRAIFQPLFPRWPQDEVPVDHVTNGIHVPTWDSKAADALWTRYCGRKRWLDGADTVQEAILEVADSDLWELRQTSRRVLVEQARHRYAREFVLFGPPAGNAAPRDVLDPDVLTLGFARRFTAYKRPTLLLHDAERLVRMLCNAEHPVQLIVAGKAHPADHEGQEMIRAWIRFTRRPDVLGRAIFLTDYDMLLTEELVGGVDVWINTPRRPWEACGTSGMKVLVNGGLNLSELDGWWAEAYSPEVGWAIGDGREHDNDPAWDAAEAEAMYRLLEDEVIPQFYRRDADGVPRQWVAKMRASMAGLTARFSAHRAVREYTRGPYMQAAAAYAARRASNGQTGVAIAAWRKALKENWSSMHFASTRVETIDGNHYLEVAVNFGTVAPDAVLVELYADVPGAPAFRQAMTRGHVMPDSKNTYLYTARVPSNRPASDYTPRIIPAFSGVAVPLELGLILWQR